MLTVPRSGDDGKCVGKSDSERKKEKKTIERRLGLKKGKQRLSRSH